MSDVVLTAIVTGAVGVIGNIVQYLATRRQTLVELEKIAADDARAHAARVEDSRQARRSTYQRLLTVLHDLDRLASSDAPGPDDSLRLGNEYLVVQTDVLLDAPRAVSDALASLTDILADIQQEATREDPADPYNVIEFQRAYRSRTAAVIEARGALLSAIHDDVTKPLLPTD